MNSSIPTTGLCLFSAPRTYVDVAGVGHDVLHLYAAGHTRSGTAFREVGRVIRTVQLLRYLSDAPLRRRVTAATKKVESFNRFSQWVGFGNQGVLADNDPIEQEKAMYFSHFGVSGSGSVSGPVTRSVRAGTSEACGIRTGAG